MAQTEYERSDAAKDAEQTGEVSRVNELIGLITTDVKQLVADEVALAKAELIPSGKHAGIGSGMFAGAGYFALNGLSLWFIAGALGIGRLFGAPTGWASLGFVVMGLLVLLVAGVLALIGKSQMDKVKGPEKAISNGKAVIEEAKLAITRANTRQQTMALEVKSMDHPDLHNPGNLG